jgi:hypothetical protein
VAITYVLAAYSLTVRKARDSTALPLDNFNGVGGDVLVALRGFLAWVKDNPVHDKDEKRLFEVGSGNATNKRTLKVTTEGGEYGYESTFRNAVTGQPSGTRTMDDAELLPLRTWFFVPKSRTTALMLTERVGSHGVAGAMRTHFTMAFQAKYPGYTVDLKPLAPADAFGAAFDEGAVRAIHLVKHTIPDDLAAQFELSAGTGTVLGSVTTVIQAPRRGLLPKKAIKDVLAGTKTASSLLSVGGADYDELRVEVRVGRSRRVLNVTTQAPPRVTFPFPATVTGRPTDGDVWEAATALAADLAPHIGLTGTLDQPMTWTPALNDVRLPVPPPSS